jgi:hypothetical protein
MQFIGRFAGHFPHIRALFAGKVHLNWSRSLPWAPPQAGWMPFASSCSLCRLTATSLTSSFSIWIPRTTACCPRYWRRGRAWWSVRFATE